MQVEKQYTKYLLTDGDFTLRVKIGDRITFQSLPRTKQRFDDINASENVFIFKRSNPDIIAKFGKAFTLAAKMAKENK